MICRFNPIDLITLTVRSFFHSPISSLLGPNISLRVLFSNTLSLHSSFNLRHHVSQPYSTTGNSIVLEILNFKWLLNKYRKITLIFICIIINHWKMKSCSVTYGRISLIRGLIVRWLSFSAIIALFLESPGCDILTELLRDTGTTRSLLMCFGTNLFCTYWGQ